MEAECADVIGLAHYRGVLQAERAGRKQGGEGTGGNRQPLPNMMHETGVRQSNIAELPPNYVSDSVLSKAQSKSSVSKS